VSGILLLAISAMPGCSLVGFGAQVFDGETTRQVDARYTNLTGQRVAVLVAASDNTLFQHPQARQVITKTISRRLAENVKNISLMNPEQVIDYQVANPYWHTLPYSDVLEKLEVDRIVLVDLVDYRTHEPGNDHVYRGLISANVGVLEADAVEPDNFAFRRQVRVQYPTDSKVGVVNADEQTIELATVKRFTDQAAGLFYNHETTE
jgi:hypothetical protein